MKLNKEKFLKTEFGMELTCMITAWDQNLEKNRRTEENKEILNALIWCQAQWEVYRMAIRHCYGVEYHFTRTDEYYGICTEDENNWLMKVTREPVSQRRPAPEYGTDVSDIADAGSRRGDLTPETDTHAKRKFEYQGNPYHALCKKLEGKIKRDIGIFPAE